MVVDFNLYLITDRRLVRRGTLLDAIKSALDGGVKAVCIREKDLTGRELMRLSEKARVLTAAYGGRLFINDRVDVALAVSADGVHLPANGFKPGDVRPLMGRKKLIGISTHSVKEALKAEKDGADFITLGPVYYTATKARYGNPLGTGPLKKSAEALRIPVFALGGINSGERIREVLRAGGAGVQGVALISAVMAAKNVKKAAENILKELDTFY